MKSNLMTEFLTRMQDDINRYGTKEYQLTTDRTISDLIIPKFLLFVLKDFDCPDVKDVLTNWIETGKPDKDAARAASYAAESFSSSAVYAALYAALYANEDPEASSAKAVWCSNVVWCAATLAAADASTNRAKTYNSYGDELLRLMGETA